MIHKIELPDCAEYLRWIVNLQQKLLEAVCTNNVNSSQVTVDWVFDQVASFGIEKHWLDEFCNRRDTIREKAKDANSKSFGRTMIEHLQIIADYPLQIKLNVITAFMNNVSFLDKFDESVLSRHLIDISSDITTNETANLASIRGFLESFYSPNFYKDCGYPIRNSKGQTTKFHRNIYLDQYLRKNQYRVEVCPYCDGDLGSPEIDHFYSKSKYPQLSCHPINLIPVCGTCNSSENKGNKVPLSIEMSDQMQEWLHPFLRSASGQFEVYFEQEQEWVQPILKGYGAVDQKQIDNFCELIGLQKRWRLALSRKTHATQKKLRQYFLNNQSQVTEEALVHKLKDLAQDVASAIGIECFAILEACYLQSAARQDPVTFEELWFYLVDNGPSVQWIVKHSD